jgi:hypothetical protein
MNSLLLALSLSNSFTKVGAIAAFVALVGIAILSMLVFSQAREIKRLRDWAGRAPERAVELEQRVSADAAARIQRSAPPQGRVVPRATPLVSAPVSTAVHASAAAVPAAAAAASGARAAVPATTAGTAAAAGPVPAAAPLPATPLQPAATGQTPSATPAAASLAAAQPSATPSPSANSSPGAPSSAGVAPVTQAAADRSSAVAAHVSSPPATAAISAGASPTGTPGVETAPTTPAVDTSSPAPRPEPASGAVPAASAAVPATAAAQSASRVARSPLPPSPSAPRPAPPRSASAPPVVAASSRARASVRPPALASGGDRRDYRQQRSPARATLLILGGVIALALVVALAVTVLKGGSGAPTRSVSTGEVARTAAAKHHRTGHSAQASAVNPAEVSVAVMNGTGTTGLAHHLAADLQQSGYSQALASAAVPPGTHQITVVQYASGHRPDAEAVAKALNVAQVQPIEGQIAAQSGSATVVVLAGADQAALLGGGGAQSQGEPAASGTSGAAGGQ